MISIWTLPWKQVYHLIAIHLVACHQRLLLHLLVQLSTPPLLANMSPYSIPHPPSPAPSPLLLWSLLDSFCIASFCYVSFHKWKSRIMRKLRALSRHHKVTIRVQQQHGLYLAVWTGPGPAWFYSLFDCSLNPLRTTAWCLKFHVHLSSCTKAVPASNLLALC